jgi:glutathione S-transferase
MSGSKPTLYVCATDEGGPSLHPCRRVQKALRDAGIEFDKIVAGPGRPLGFGMKGKRPALKEATGEERLPALKLPDGTVITHSPSILKWVRERRAATIRS